eukprot:gb/GEZN01002021.1/.p1 GENE.gb/GEZN01002021.1/~~gb/GEZN01002021.1/.p1  ORF type:complete len:801 (-),score=112.24 gb/GEZN01002021.1/:233-2635(-)
MSKIPLLQKPISQAVEYAESLFPTDFQTQPKSSVAATCCWDMALVFNVGKPGKRIEVRRPRTAAEMQYGATETMSRHQDVKVHPSDSHLLLQMAQAKTQTVTMEVDEAVFFKEETEAVYCKLQNAGLEVVMYKGAVAGTFICLIGATEERLKHEADRVNLTMALDPDGVIDAAGKQHPPMALYLRYTSQRPEDKIISKELFYDLFGKYDLAIDAQFPGFYTRYDHGEFGQSLFRTTDRLKLVKDIIEAEARLGGAELRARLNADNVLNPVAAFFPLHEITMRDALRDAWMRPAACWFQPIQQIREYYGESIGLYFAFSELYNCWLIPISFFGVIGFVVERVTGNINNLFNAVLALFIAIWTSILLEMWKRREAKLQLDWGMHKFEQQEQPRPQFQGEWRPSTVSGRLEEYFDPAHGFQRKIRSQLTIMTMIMTVIAMVVGLFIFRNFLLLWNPAYGGVLAGVLNAFQIQLLNVIYGKVAVWLNDYENHTTQTQYEDALIVKSFLFKFVNSYNSLFYIAFFKRFDLSVDGCADQDPTCMTELQTQLASIFMTALVIGNISEMGSPWMKTRQLARIKEKAESEGRPLSQAEEEYYLEPYESTLGDFDEVVIQYGYVTLFAVAFPLSPLLALVNNYFETKIDASKLCTYSRRPHPRGAADIGSWYAILEIMSVVAVVTNVALIFFVSTSADRLTGGKLEWQVLYFILLEHGILIVKGLLQLAIPDQTLKDKNRQDRINYIEQQIIDGTREEIVDSHDSHTNKRSDFDLKSLKYADEDERVRVIFKKRQSAEAIPMKIPFRLSS